MLQIGRGGLYNFDIESAYLREIKIKGKVISMKKHQKVLLGLMVLGLAGGVGTAVALTRTAATSSIDYGTDQAIYLNWGTNDQNTATAVEVGNFSAGVTQYRCLVVATKLSKAVTGTVYIKFTLATEDKTELPGFKVGIYSIDSYANADDSLASATKAGTLLSTLDITSAATYTATFDVDGEASTEPTHYYGLGFTYDGTALSGTDTTFGGSLKITQTFKTTAEAQESQQ